MFHIADSDLLCHPMRWLFVGAMTAFATKEAGSMTILVVACYLELNARYNMNWVHEAGNKVTYFLLRN